MYATQARHRHGRHRVQVVPIRHRQGWDKWAAKAAADPFVPEAAPMPVTPVSDPAMRRRALYLSALAVMVSFLALVTTVVLVWGVR